jgi:GT2 family glycosyltransferase
MIHSPVVCAIILNWNGWQDTMRCHGSLKAQDYPSLRTLVVDNGSTDGSADRLEAAGIDWLRLSDNHGFAGGMNRGVQLAVEDGAQYVLMVNNDAVLAPDVVSKLIAGLERDPDAALAAPTIFHLDPPEKVWYAGGAFSPWTGTVMHWTRRRSETPMRVTFATGCCLLMRVEAFQALGGMNEDYFLYFEDVELCNRLTRQGYGLLYVPSAHVWHAVGASTGSQLQKAPDLDYYDVRNSLTFISRHLRGPSRLSALLFFWVIRLPRKLIRILVASKFPLDGLLAVALGLGAAMRGEGGPRHRPKAGAC